MGLNLALQQDRLMLTGMIQRDIEAWSRKFDDGIRSHLGASIIGHKCDRFLWYTFRWMFYQVHDGRMLRLFQRGHREEIWLWEMLREQGWTVLEVDPATGKQWRVEAIGGHFSGSMDAIGYPPPSYGINEWLLLECKTNKSGENGAKFKELVRDLIEKNKPLHFAQSNVYASLKKLNYYVYFNTNKDTDQIHVEVNPMNPIAAEKNLRKAEFVILSQTAPARIHPNASFYECRYCDAVEICHKGAAILRNCRSCAYATPAADKQWYCNGHNAVIPKDLIPKGCAHWMGLVH